jgi:hypothetical protein
MSSSRSQVGAHRLTVDFFSDSHRISTQFATRGRPLADTLNDHTLSYLDLDVAYISRIDKPGQLVADYSLAILRKENISFCVVATQVELAVKSAPQAALFARRHRPMFCTVPSFELTGLMEVPPNLDLRSMLAIGTERFMPIHRAKATISILPSVTFEGQIILVNKEKIEVLGVSDAAEPSKAAPRSG